MNQNKDKALDNMIGFKERTSAQQLKKWAKNLQINADVLTTQVKPDKNRDPTEKEERKMIRDIVAQQKREMK